MKLKLALTALVALAAAIVPAVPAAAGTRHLEGGFRADPDARISMDVVLRHGRPVEVRDLRFTGLDYTCEGSGASGDIDAELGSTPIFRSARGGYEFEAEPTGTGLGVVVAGGLLGRSARTVKGGVAYFFSDASGATCDSLFDGRYVAR